MKPKFPSIRFFSASEVTMFRAKITRLIAMVLSIVLIAGAISPTPARAQTPSPYDPIITHLKDAFSYGYGGLLDLRLLAGYLTVGQNGRALSVAELNGVNQQWQTLLQEGQAANKSNLDLSLLGLIYINLGSISLPLVGAGGLLEFVLTGASVGVLREFAHAPSANKAIGAVGVVSDSGALEVTQPGEGANATIDLLSLLSLSSTTITAGVVDEASISLGAVSSAAEKPNWGDGETCETGYAQLDDANFPATDALVGADMALLATEEDEKLCSKYQIADAKVVIDSPRVGELVTDLQGTLDFLLLGVESSLNAALGTGGALDAIYTAPVIGPVLNGVVDINATVNIDQTDISTALTNEPLADSTGLVSIDLKTGKITIDVEKLHAGNPNGLNGLDPNTPLVTSAQLGQITQTVTNLLSASKSVEPNGLNAKLDNLLRGNGTTKRGGLYATEISLETCVLGAFNSCTLEADITGTLGGFLTGATETPNYATYKANPYTYYYRSGTLGLVLSSVIVPLLSTVGTIVEGLLFGNDTGLLGGVLGDLQTQVLLRVVNALNPVLTQILAPLANIIVNRQFLTKVAHGNVFTVSALEVNIVDLNSPNTVVHLPLATSSVMAQHWAIQKLTFNVAKTGDGRNLHNGGYTYDFLCKVDNTTIVEKINDGTTDESLNYAAGNVGTNFNYTTGPNQLALVGATGISLEVQVPAGAICEVTANPSLEDETFVALRATGSPATRTAYTYFLDTDSDGLYVSDALGTTTNTWALLTDLNSLDTTAVEDEWKTHSLKFAVRGDSAARANIAIDTEPQAVNIVHAYDIDTRDIEVSKAVVGDATPTSAFNFQYSINGGVWSTINTIAAGGKFTIEDVPVLKSDLSASIVSVREVVSGLPAELAVSWAVGTGTPVTGTTGGGYSTSPDITVNAGLTAEDPTTPNILLTATNTFPAPVSVDFEAMLPETGRTSLVWVLGLGILAALGAVIMYIRSRRQ